MLSQVLATLRDNFKFGQRNYTIFQVGKATLLRVSDVISLKKADVFDEEGEVRRNAFIVDNYQLANPDCQVYTSEWLFPSFQRPERHITEHQYYKVMHKVGDLLGLNYLGTHTMRKTGAYRVYVQSNYNIGLVMKLLNHSSEAMTLAYLGLDQQSREDLLDQIDFGGIN